MVYRPFQSTYYDAQMRASPALLRARAPYLIKNTITGTAIFATAIGIFDAYTIHVISQDEFDDVIVPDKPIHRTDAQSVVERARQASDARKHQES
ncbi:hypothetical protein BU24DRAFT_229860 [Aaosphaeria arxii CBS 175.79]|uniref:Cytochrome c oxidase assembly factor 3 n=1 Tax=Aaosphaeria arxii CBS 175.79 TaxID=1450172 RepID=A0A6A5XIL4_9PLEO|nr:uncharacterized protein BU24DRAFT_229860 [Aaosphaeria arxii CBS 175.79]KAF2013098.1 hypothetical protein BU24DRAFT_229860 [Aaosphaeria arxii CBS 175.79]